MRIRFFHVLFLGCLMLTACGAPANFIRSNDSTTLLWHNIEVRDRLKFDDAWKLTVDTIAQRFDIEIVSKDSAYLRTAWDYKWTGNYTKYYAVRAIVKFSPDRRYLQIKSEATYKDQVGEDERFTQTLKSDLMGKVGRVSR